LGFGSGVQSKLADVNSNWGVAGNGIDILVSEWNVSESKDDNGVDNSPISGMMRNAGLMRTFYEMIENGVDMATIWTGDSGTSRVALSRDADGVPLLTPTGLLFRMLSENLPGTNVFLSNPEIRDDSNTRVGYSMEFQGDGRTVVYFVSGVNAQFTIDADFSGVMAGSTHVQATVLGPLGGIPDDANVQGMLSLPTLAALGHDGNGILDITLDPYELIQLVFTDTTGSTGVALTGDDQNPINDTLTGSVNADQIAGMGGNDSLFGGGGADVIYGGDGGDTIDGGGQGDTVHAGAGNDKVIGGYGPDLIYLDAGSDLFEDINQGGDYGRDTVYGGDGNDQILGQNGDDSFFGEAGKDSIEGGDGNDTLLGQSGNDTLLGQSDCDLLGGGDGNDLLGGGNGNDDVYGADGQDSLFGGADGNDSLTGGDGADQLTGGTENDVFVYRAATDSTVASRDTITDFTAGDIVSLEVIDANALIGGNQEFTFIGGGAFSNIAGELRFVADGTTGFVVGDVDGDGETDLVIRLLSVTSMDVSDFLL